MAHWVITEEYLDRLRPIARFETTREEALSMLYETACSHRFTKGLIQQRREVFRVDDCTYYVEVLGAMSTYRLRYCLAERVWSTDT
ncbi:hypothetical protein [Streptomyces shaanxiensis]|uniref:Uncharacterized protein n=1 Tax=Streptomyces shaanxiensis TaxID=653357 RepID=A0ABP7UB56_9ACTN